MFDKFEKIIERLMQKSDILNIYRFTNDTNRWNSFTEFLQNELENNLPQKLNGTFHWMSKTAHNSFCQKELINKIQKSRSVNQNKRFFYNLENFTEKQLSNCS